LEFLTIRRNFVTFRRNFRQSAGISGNSPELATCNTTSSGFRHLTPKQRLDLLAAAQAADKQLRQTCW